MLDASGVPTAKMYFGGTYWLGNRDLCKETSHPKNIPMSENFGPVYKETAKDIPPFPLAYFAAYFQHHSNIQMVTHMENEVSLISFDNTFLNTDLIFIVYFKFRITWSMCLPESCNGPELNELLKKYFNQNVLFHQFIYNTTYEMEEVKKLEDDYSWLSDTKISAMGLD